MKLIDDWKRVLKGAHSVRWAACSGIFGGLEVILPLFVDSIPRGWFAAASMFAAVGSMVARVKAQPELHDGN